VGGFAEGVVVEAGGLGLFGHGVTSGCP
jgi:hypothetical protein